jgi:phosphoribosylanthranilate isomerase
VSNARHPSPQLLETEPAEPIPRLRSAAKLRNHATFFLITYLNRAGAILELCHNLSVKMVQLHGETDLEQIRLLKQEAPQLRIIKSLIVRGSNADILIAEVRRYEASVDSFITDTFDPATGTSGATGRVHDWEISRRLVALSARPLILASGLNAGNVRQAIRTVRPAGVERAHGNRGPRRAQALRFDKAFRRRGTGWVFGD